MNYKCPIDLIVSEMNLRMDGEIFKAVQNVGVNVDRDELIKALQYDRNQYQKGYADRDAEIVRCKDCEHRHSLTGTCVNIDGACFQSYVGDDWFCADGVTKEDVSDKADIRELH